MFKKINLMIILLVFIMLIPVCFANDLQSDAIAANDTSDANVQINEYYFDSNATEEGNGTLDSPFKYLTEARVKENYVLHFANGEYSFTSSKIRNNVSFIGSDVSQTHIVCKGSVNCGSNLIFKNITFSNAQFSVADVINASNVVFKNSVAKSVGSYGNSYGGAIYSSKSSDAIYLNNCTFIDNFAQYGGAIYMNGGFLDIENTLFINNLAYNYGGAIAGESNSRIKIRNSTFIKSRSSNDAGGAIYLNSASFEANMLNIANSSATFGGALALLKTNSNLENIYLFNNSARYDGGAIYQVLGNMAVNNASFNNNSAVNGAGLYVGRCGNVSVANTTFENNNASGRAILYSILNNALFLSAVDYKNNHALNNNDFYNSSTLDLFVSNGNYTLFLHNSSYTGQFPSQFLLNNLNVKDQQDGGNCWAFATLASLESCILNANGGNYDFSEENMKNLMALYSDFGWDMNTNDGGYVDMGVGYLASWLGPVLAVNDSYDGQSTLSPILNSITHVQNIIYLKRNNFTDNDAVKKAIMDYGGLYSPIYMTPKYDSTTKQYVQYCGSGQASNHAICIVGWDDDFKVSGAPDKGAWICKNSWSNTWGNKGYFYVSYYDTTCLRVGVFDAGFTFLFNDTLKFDKNYQYDISGKTDYFYIATNTVWYKNRFVSTGDEYLAAVSTYFCSDTDWTLSIYVNDNLVSTQEGFSTPGYRTIELNDLIAIHEGDVFEAVFKMVVNGDVGVPISEAVSLVSKVYYENISFVSIDGNKWFDFYDLAGDYPGHYYNSQVACIKAFTILDKVNTTLTFKIAVDEFGELNITAKVLNQYGRIVHGGKVVFNINGINHIVDVDDGIAKLTKSLDIGLNNISLQYNGVGFISSSNSISVLLSKCMVNMDWNISTVLDSAEIQINFSRPINETVVITVSGSQHVIKSKNGTVTLKVENLSVGLNDIKVELQSDVYDASDIISNFTINQLKTNIELINSQVIFGSGNSFRFRLMDENSQMLANKTIRYILNNKTYLTTTDENGLIDIDSDLAVGNYSLIVEFDTTKMYLNSTAICNVTVMSSIELSDIDVFTYNSTFKAYFLDKLGNNLSGVADIIIDGVRHEVLVCDGVGCVDVFLNPGSYLVEVCNLETGEVKNQTVSVLERILENEDLTVHYGSPMVYKVRVLGDNGENASDVSVVFYIGGETYVNLTDSEGYAYVDLNLQPGVYEISSEYMGYSVRNTLTVKSTVELSDIDVFTYNSTFKAYFLDKLGNNLSGVADIVIGGVRHEVLVCEGVGCVDVFLNPGSYLVEVCNLETGEVKNQTVSVLERILENEDLTVYYGSPVVYKVRVLDDHGDNALKVPVAFKIGGETYVSLTDDEGYVSLALNLPLGVYEISSEYMGYSVRNTLTVKSTVELSDIDVFTYNSTFSARFLDNSGNSLSGVADIVIDGVKYEVLVCDGVGCVDVFLNPGSYLVDVSNPVTGEVKNQTVSVFERILENKDLIVYYGSPVVYKVRVLGDHGENAANVPVVFDIGGQTYVSLTDDEGHASIALNLPLGVHEIACAYKGYSVRNNLTVRSSIELSDIDVFTYGSTFKARFLDKSGNNLSGKVLIRLGGNYYDVLVSDGIGRADVLLNPGSYLVQVSNLETGEVKNQTIKVASRLTAAGFTMYFGADKYYKVRAYDDHGNVARNVKVTIIFNGKTYYRNTDSNGYASLKISANPKTYTVSAMYKGFKVSNKITIKPTLITKDMAVKKGKILKFNVKLLNSNGKILKNKKITVKFKGKTYNVKTNAKGIAAFKIKVNSKIGKFTITTSYGSMKNTNNITVKK